MTILNGFKNDDWNRLSQQEQNEWHHTLSFDPSNNRNIIEEFRWLPLLPLREHSVIRYYVFDDKTMAHKASKYALVKWADDPTTKPTRVHSFKDLTPALIACKLTG